MTRSRRRTTSRKFGLQRMGTTKSLSSTSTTTSPTPIEPLGEVIHQYTDILCTTQKQTNLTNSLLENITVFNEYDPTKLEDWLIDIKTAADLT